MILLYTVYVYFISTVRRCSRNCCCKYPSSDVVVLYTVVQGTCIYIYLYVCIYIYIYMYIYTVRSGGYDTATAQCTRGCEVLPICGNDKTSHGILSGESID
jgi:hypothetical protein